MNRRILAAFAGLGIAACNGPDAGIRWLGPVTEVAAPVGAGSRFPHLAPAVDGRVVMSWLEPVNEGAFALRYSNWHGHSWDDAVTLASGRDWFINWADFPSVVPFANDALAAHWLEQRPGSVYSYDVRLSVSTDDGRTWTPPVSPHDDGTRTEHGFVSLYESAGALQAVWLDGRHTAGEHQHGGDSGGAMTLRAAAIGLDGQRIGPDSEVDPRVCDCCQTDVASTDEGAVVVYRDRSDREVRDIAVVRRTADGWSAPAHVHDDGWIIDACPVNGPAIDARGRNVAVAWFTAPDQPRVRLAFSSDSGRSFSAPIDVAHGKVAGRVDVVLLTDGRAVVSWIDERSGAAEIRAQPFTTAGAAAGPVTIAQSNVARSSGFPQMVLAGRGLLFAWTRTGESPHVLTAFAALP